MDMKHTGDYELDEINMLEQECADLEEENKRLEEENKVIKEEKEMLIRQNTLLQESNKNLKSDLEQFSEAYKRYRDFEKEELAESCYDLSKENEKLKKWIKEHVDYQTQADFRKKFNVK